MSNREIKTMESKHTPGPWAVKHSESKDSFNIIGTRLGGKNKIARVPYLSEGLKDEAYSDAQLIAAAPELLEALQELTKSIEDYYTANVKFRDWEEIDWFKNKAEQVIAKALGSSHTNGK